MTDEPAPTARSTGTPRSVWQGSFTIFGVELKCHVLDNGERVIEAEGMHKMLEAMGDNVPVDPEQLAGFARWRGGL